MAICRIIETGATPEQYDQVSERLEMGDSAPSGAEIHVAALGEDGTIRILELWDSREQADQFTDRVRAAREEVGMSAPPSITYMDVHKVRRA
jgi:hypothetical protein